MLLNSVCRCSKTSGRGMEVRGEGCGRDLAVRVGEELKAQTSNDVEILRASFA